jgi:predicted NAD-dependent protein-ADP-ribosyltransferase YbiA (DUF1768 family)
LAVGYAGGTINNLKGKNTQSSRLKFRDRLTQEINLNLKGWFMNLVPGDSSTEWMTYLGISVSDQSLARGWEDTHRIFKKYFIDEVNLSREKNRDIFVGRGEKKDEKRRHLRFFKDILDAETLANVKRSRTLDPGKLYDNNKEAIERAVEAYITKNSNNLRKVLHQYNLIVPGTKANTVSIENVGITNVSKGELDLQLDVLSVNYIISNIEMHKLVYGDPYQYKDELKRTKSFQSPRQEILNSSQEMNALMNEMWNRGFKEGSLGHTNFLRDHFRTITYNDVNVFDKLFPQYGMMEETDGGGIITLKAHRNFKLRASDWTEANEKQYRYEVRYEELYKEGKIKEAKDLKNPRVKDTFTAIKPVVTGNRKHEDTHNKVVLDKYSLYPLSFRMMIEMDAGSAVDVYNKLQKEDIDYAIFHTGRKVGAYNTVDPYTPEGPVNMEPFTEEQIIDIPFYSMGLQTEVPSKEKNELTRGSQVTKIITMDRMDAGVPLDFMPEATFTKRFKAWNAFKTNTEKAKHSPLYKLILENKELLEAQLDFGYQELLRKLGIVEKEGEVFEITDFDKTAQLIKDEVLLRETNDNIIEALNAYANASSVLEATPAYRQISNILYAIVDKNLVHTKITGGMKVQLPSTFFEKERIEMADFNGKKGYTSDALGFYSRTEDGKKVNVMEIYAGRWFKSDMSDEKLLEYLNTTDEGQKILKGFAFRIPTQNMNSIDAFVIKKFLPEEFGDNVVVPSALVGKVGSDFDIDKLSMYLKNVLAKGYDYSGKPQLVKSYEIGKDGLDDAMFDAKAYLLKEWNATEEQLEKQNYIANIFGDMAVGKRIDPKKSWKWINLFRNWFQDDMLVSPKTIDGELVVDAEGRFIGDYVIPIETIENRYIHRMEKLGKRLDELSDKDIFEEEAEILGRKLYKQGLQNAYIQNNEELLTHPTNFDKLTAPNDASLLEDLSDEIVAARGETIITYNTPINMLDRTFMTQLRHDFVAGKQGIGIAAVGQTNNALNQGQVVVVDKNKIKDLPQEEIDFLGDGNIKFSPRKYNSIDGKPTLSMIKNKASKGGQYISDLLGMFIDGFVDIANGPWVMRLGATPEVVGTWIFLIKIGVPVRDITYFINQPIIREYLQKIQNKGYSWLFIEDFVNEVKENYDSNYKGTIDEIPNVTTLKETINKKELTPVEKAEQKFYLDEFLKYSMMARHLFYFTQGSNFDTANFNNPYLLSKKEVQYAKAQTSIISSVDSVVNNTFLGNLMVKLIKSREALTKVLVSDRPNTRRVVEKALMPYVHLNDRDFVKMAQKVITNLFDWAVQTHTHLNTEIYDTLIKQGNAVQEMSKFVKEVKNDPGHDLYRNYLIESIEIIPSKSAEPGSPDNIKIKANTSEVYEQNRMIYAFKELKEFLGKDSDLYQNLVKVSLLQSGLSPSTISFTSYIPYEDFEGFYNETLSLLEDSVNLDAFNDLHILQRNNWHTSDIAEYQKAQYIPALDRYNPGMDAFLIKSIKKDVRAGLIPNILQAKIGMGTRSDYLVRSWEDYMVLTADEQQAARDRGQKLAEANAAKKQEMKDNGDYSFLHKALMKKVYRANGEPLVYTYVSKLGNVTKSHVYKAINAWGMNNRANEFYNTERPSIINNGFDKYENEISDADVISYYDGIPRKISMLPLKREELLEDYSQSTGLPMGTSITNIFYGKGDNVILSNFARRPFTYGGRQYASVEHAYQTLKSGKFNAEAYNRPNDFVEQRVRPPKNVNRNVSLKVMENLLRASFKQNEAAMKALLETGSNILTHKGGNDKFWENNFGKLLMKLRDQFNNPLKGCE